MDYVVEGSNERGFVEYVGICVGFLKLERIDEYFIKLMLAMS